MVSWRSEKKLGFAWQFKLQFPKLHCVQVYTQLVIRSMEIEKQIAFDNNNLASFRKKWATFKQCPSENNLTYTVN